MCGIIGYIGKKSASPILLEGLRRLEYRGYDSAGVAVHRCADLLVRKKKGKIDEGLARTVARRSRPTAASASATRAGPRTARPPTKIPIRTSTRPAGLPSSTTASLRITIGSRTSWSSWATRSNPDTDTEVLAHLIGEHYQKHRGQKRRYQSARARGLRRVARSHRHLRPRGRQRGPAGHDRRRATRFAADHRHRQRRKFSGERRQRHCRAHAARWFT